MRDRLIELVKKHVSGSGCLLENSSCAEKICRDCKAERFADYLIANGVILPPYKVGDTYYTVQRYCNTDPFETEKVRTSTYDCEVWCGRDDCSFREYRIEEHKWKSVITILEEAEYLGKRYFLTKEEAEKALKEKNNAE